MTDFACLDCGESYTGVNHFRCPACGGVFGIPAGIQFNSKNIKGSQPGIWRYRHTFGLPENAPTLHLGEGDTPLVPAQVNGLSIWHKLESVNPTGSYKDRLAAVMVSQLAAEGVKSAVEDSSGNAGAAFAAYSARAGIHARVFVPASAAGPKLAQIERYGADVIEVPGPRQAAADAVLVAVQEGSIYASHAYLPHGMVGIATIAYELVDQLGRAPGTVIAPVGHGGLLLGILLGFKAILEAGMITSMPKLIGVQAENNAPLWAAANNQKFHPGSTIAAGIAVTHPVRGPELLALHREGLVDFVVVYDKAILAGQQALAGQGIDAEPTSAIIIDAYRQLIHSPGELAEPVVGIISGHGLKA